MPYFDMRSLTSGLEVTPYSIGGWREHLFRWTNGDKGEIRQANKKYLIEDINNDSKSEYVQRISDSNNVSDGYGWIVIPNFTPQNDSVVDGQLYVSSPDFHFRDNNIDDSNDGERRIKKDLGGEVISTGNNFFFDFFNWENKRYLFLLVNYGYKSAVFEQRVIVSDLGEDFKIKADHCHMQFSVENVGGRLNKY